MLFSNSLILLHILYYYTVLYFIIIFLLLWQLQRFTFCLLSYQWCMINLNREKARKWEREIHIFPCVPLFRLLQSWRSIKRGICIPPTFTSISSVTGDRISVSVCLPFTPPPYEFVESLSEVPISAPPYLAAKCMSFTMTVIRRA